MYFCVGGPAEIQDGGIHGADNYFTKMETADSVVEKRLLDIVGKSDLVITMGNKAVDFLRKKGVNTEIKVVSGGINRKRFYPTNEAPLYDLILIGRLVEIKRIDIFLNAVKHVAQRITEVVSESGYRKQCEIHGISRRYRILAV
jgi:glycosyltransferase involved in cell wall biosynthesis